MSKSNLETELKFLLDSLPEFSPTEIYEIEQIYLDKMSISEDFLKEIFTDYGSFDDIAEIRIRKKTNIIVSNSKYFFTVKTQGDLTRGEYESEISVDQYDKFRNEIKNIGSLTKNRYVNDINGFKYEFDEYTGTAHKGLVILEVELPNENFVISDIVQQIGETFKITNIKDVTYDKNYKNKNLARFASD